MLLGLAIVLIVLLFAEDIKAAVIKTRSKFKAPVEPEYEYDKSLYTISYSEDAEIYSAWRNENPEIIGLGENPSSALQDLLQTPIVTWDGSPERVNDYYSKYQHLTNYLKN